ncbi:MAG: hypothetical protein V4773_13315 [Verrucomicrobiota bacterium]
MKDILGAFGVGPIRFVCDPKYTNVRLPGSVSLQENDFAAQLEFTGQLPVLGGAPIAAWVLARMASVAGPRFPYSYGQVFGSDGDDFWIVALAFSTAEQVRPVGSVSILGGRNYVKLWLDIVAPVAPEDVKRAFQEALLAAPMELRRALVTVVYTAFEDPAHATHVPYTLGWDGTSFISRESPAHAVFPEDLE